MKKLLVLAVIVSLIGMATPVCGYDLLKGELDPISKADWYFIAAAELVNLIDWGQTRYIADNPDLFEETNHELGYDPTLKQVDKHFIECMATRIVYYIFLPEKLRKIYCIYVVNYEWSYISGNYTIGIKTKF